jgi:hypothetical protein
LRFNLRIFFPCFILVIEIFDEEINFNENLIKKEIDEDAIKNLEEHISYILNKKLIKFFIKIFY